MEIICYLSNGYPSLNDSYNIAKEYASAGCNMIEIDFPSRNPYLEGEYIANRMKKALEVCDDYDKYMESIIRVKNNLPGVKLLVLAYENTIREIGVDKFINFCIENDFKDLLLVGLENELIKNKIIDSGIRVSCYVQYHLLEEEIEYAKKSNGFVYMQAKPTNGLMNKEYPELKDCINYLKKCGIDRPIYCGVGVHSPEDVRMVKESGGDAAFVGSTILKLQDDIPTMRHMIQKFKAEC